MFKLNVTPRERWCGVTFNDHLPTANIVAMILIMVQEKNQRVGDIVGGTVVVKQK